MGLLNRGNRKATRRSVVMHACVWLMLTTVAYAAGCVWSPLLRAHWRSLVPVAMVLSAGIGALMEWQLDDGPESDDEGGEP
jgi:hypothetical protein